MAFEVRTINDIFSDLLLEKQNIPSLSALVPKDITDEQTLIPKLTEGAAPEWVLWLYNIAVQMHLQEVKTGEAVTDIETFIQNQKIHGDTWYINTALAFQLDDDVIIDPITKQISYEEIDEAKQIIGSCTIQSQTSRIYLKLRRKDTNILTENEKLQFTSYMEKAKEAGVQIIVENYEGDELSLYMTILYNSIYPLETVKEQVENTINDYLNNLEFNSEFVVNSLIDKLQLLSTVKDPQFNYGVAIDALGEDVEFLHQYKTNAGWAKIKASTPLSATITYIPKLS